MAELKTISINLDSPRAVFYSGQEVTGSLEIELGSPLTFTVIYVKFLGHALVDWNEQETEVVNGNKRYKNVKYAGREEYFNVMQLLAGSYGAESQLNPGKYKYPFRYQIPPGVPSTFDGGRGRVAYSVSACVEFQGQGVFREMVKSFEVVAPFDLNKGSPRVREPLELDFEESVGCGCFSSRPVRVRVRAPASAYCPGQPVPLSVAAHNQSGVEITKIVFQLLTRQKYRSQRPIAEYVEPEEVLTTVKKGSIMSGSERNFTVDLVVPDLIAPNLQNCSIIDVGYFIRVTIKLSGCNEDLQDEVEMCLGLVPLKETCTSYVHPLAHSLPPGPVPDLPPVPPVPHMTGSVAAILERPLMAGAVRDGSYGFMQVHEQVISSDPSQNYEAGFKVTYSPGGAPAAVQHQYNQFSQQMPFPTDSNMSIRVQSFSQTSREYVAPSAPPL